MNNFKSKFLLLFLSLISIYAFGYNGISFEDYGDPEDDRYFWETPLGILLIIIGIIYYTRKQR